MRYLILLLSLAALAGAAEPRKFSSGENRTHLLELFSSEGCSSCPPAEQWLGELRDAPGLWDEFVPVAFHVVYWDRLGWPDRFAAKTYTERQYAYAAAWRTDNVYTPEFVLDGAEWRRSSGRGLFLPAAARAGVLTVEFAPDRTCRVTFTGDGRYEVHVSELGGGIVSRIGAGENDGRTLHHEFVALSLTRTSLVAGAAEVKLPQREIAGVPRRALAVWITRPGELTPVQATGGWLN